MKTIALKCANCGAAATAKPKDETVKCEYCGTVSLIQRRAGYLERLQEVEKRARPQYQDLPVAREERSRWWWPKVSAPFLLYLPALILLITGGPFGPLLKWRGEEPPILHDVNGDGVADVIGLVERGSTIFGGYAPRVRVAVVDGATGDVLWSTELVPIVETGLGWEIPAVLTLDDDKVVMAYKDYQAFEARSLAWNVDTGQEVEVYGLDYDDIANAEPPPAPVIPEETLFAIHQARESEGEGWEHPAVSDTMAFATFELDLVGYIVAHSLEDGRRIWKAEFGEGAEVNALSYATGSLYVSGYRRLRILDAADGRERVSIGPLVW